MCTYREFVLCVPSTYDKEYAPFLTGVTKEPTEWNTCRMNDKDVGTGAVGCTCMVTFVGLTTFITSWVINIITGFVLVEPMKILAKFLICKK